MLELITKYYNFRANKDMGRESYIVVLCNFTPKVTCFWLFFFFLFLMKNQGTANE